MECNVLLYSIQKWGVRLVFFTDGFREGFLSQRFTTFLVDFGDESIIVWIAEGRQNFGG